MSKLEILPEFLQTWEGFCRAKNNLIWTKRCVPKCREFFLLVREGDTSFKHCWVLKKKIKVMTCHILLSQTQIKISINSRRQNIHPGKCLILSFANHDNYVLWNQAVSLVVKCINSSNNAYFKYIKNFFHYFLWFFLSRSIWHQWGRLTRWDSRQGQLFSTFVDSHKCCEIWNFHLIMRIV